MLFKYEVKKILWKKGARAALAILALWMIGSLFLLSIFPAGYRRMGQSSMDSRL